MPKAFENCRKNGGRIRTATGKKKKDRDQFGLKENQYMKICIHKGKFYRGHVHTKKNK